MVPAQSRLFNRFLHPQRTASGHSRFRNGLWSSQRSEPSEARECFTLDQWPRRVSNGSLVPVDQASGRFGADHACGYVAGSWIRDQLRSGRRQGPNSIGQSQSPLQVRVSGAAVQRLEPVADLIRLHDAGHQAVIGSPSSAAATMTGIKGTSVLRGSGLHVS